LANVMLDDLDKHLESRQLRFARYADDFTICVKSTSAGHRVMLIPSILFNVSVYSRILPSLIINRSNQMLEINPILTQINDMQSRSESLRGYL